MKSALVHEVPWPVECDLNYGIGLIIPPGSIFHRATSLDYFIGPAFQNVSFCFVDVRGRFTFVPIREIRVRFLLSQFLIYL